MNSRLNKYNISTAGKSKTLGELFLQNFSFVCLDFETTGLEESAEIIEIGMVKVVDGQVTDRYNQLVQPRRPIPQSITLLTGIDEDMV